MPTFGYTATDGTPTVLSAADAATVARFALTEAGSLTKLSAYMKVQTGTTNVKGVLYASATNPGALLGVTAAAALSSTTYLWLDLTFGSPVALPAATYYLGIVPDDASDVMVKAVGGSKLFLESANSYASPVDPFGGGSGIDDFLMSIYATYTASDPARIIIGAPA